jgi:hypothetical protein
MKPYATLLLLIVLALLTSLFVLALLALNHPDTDVPLPEATWSTQYLEGADGRWYIHCEGDCGHLLAMTDIATLNRGYATLDDAARYLSAVMQINFQMPRISPTPRTES